MLPYTLNNNFEENYTYPPTITEPEGHDYFTSGFTALQLTLRGFSLIYYGVDTSDWEAQLWKFDYDIETDTLILNEEEPELSELYMPFAKCAEGEALYKREQIYF